MKRRRNGRRRNIDGKSELDRGPKVKVDLQQSAKGRGREPGQRQASRKKDDPTIVLVIKAHSAQPSSAEQA